MFQAHVSWHVAGEDHRRTAGRGVMRSTAGGAFGISPGALAYANLKFTKLINTYANYANSWIWRQKAKKHGFLLFSPFFTVKT